MWFLLVKRLLRRRSFFFYAVVGLSILLLTLVGLGWYVIHQNNVLRLLISGKANSINRSVEGKAVGPLEYYLKKYGNKPGNGEITQSGERGNGLNLLLIDQITAEPYAKELLQLYKDSSEGKLYDSKVHVSLEGLLAKHFNEVGTYNGHLLRSYIPYENKKVQWNVARGDFPGEAFTLKGINKNVIDSGRVGSIPSFGPLRRSGASYVNAFQININYFQNDDYKSKLYGFGHANSENRKADGYYLPDQLAYLDNQFSEMVSRFSLDGVESELLNGMYAIWHNGGAGHAEFFNGFGVWPPSKLKYNSSSIQRSSVKDQLVVEWKNNLTSMPKTMLQQTKEYLDKNPTLFDNTGRGYGVGVLMLLKGGYYLTPKVYEVLSGPAHISQLTYAYNLMNNTNKSSSEVVEELSKYVKEPWQVEPFYMDEETFNKVYGNVPYQDSNGLNKGIIWKLEDTTSEAYSSTVNGNPPRILHRTNWEVAGFVWDLQSRGRSVYAKMLAYSGVGIDPTNPSTYMQKIDGSNTFSPSGGDFAKILQKIGISNIDPKVYDMLKWAYDRAGFYYYLGGGGKQVSQANFKFHQSYINYASNSSLPTKNYFQTKLYVKKDGTPATADTPDSELLNFGKYLFDCSTLTGLAYNETIGKATGTKVVTSSYSQLADNENFVTINDWSQAKPGDIFVNNGHVFFYLATNTSGAATEIGKNESLTEANKKDVAHSGWIWALEASTSNQIVGIRAQPMPSKSKYTLRRFKELAS